jgi:erythrin-vacuolar iron transport family protein
MSKTTEPKSLSVALDFEEKGRRFYVKTASEVTHPLSKTLFQALAEDEVRHAERIHAIYTALTEGRSWPDPSLGVGHRLEAELKAFFETHRAALGEKTTNLEGYEFAMKLERTGVELYTKFAQEAADPKEKSFFEALAAEERGHLAALDNVHAFLTRPGDWLQDDESHHWNWMNL